MVSEILQIIRSTEMQAFVPSLPSQSANRYSIRTVLEQLCEG